MTVSQRKACPAEQTAVHRIDRDLADLLQHLRQETRPGQMMAAGLAGAMKVLGADGAAIIRAAAAPISDGPEVVHRAGLDGPPATIADALLGQAEIAAPALARELNGRPVAVAVCRESMAEKLGLAVWRRRGARVWSCGDAPMLDAIAGVLSLLLARESGAHEFAHTMRT